MKIYDAIPNLGISLIYKDKGKGNLSNDKHDLLVAKLHKPAENDFPYIERENDGRHDGTFESPDIVFCTKNNTIMGGIYIVRDTFYYDSNGNKCCKKIGQQLACDIEDRLPAFYPIVEEMPMLDNPLLFNPMDIAWWFYADEGIDLC